MTPFAFGRSMWRFMAGLARRIRDDRGGVAAVEFAIILPLMLTMYVGTVEVTKGVMANRKVNLVSRTLSDLIAQQPTSTQSTSTPSPSNAVQMSTVTDILGASTAIMSPYPVTTLTMTVSAIDILNKSNGQCCDAKVRWSYTQGGTLRPCTTPLTQVAATVTAAPTNIPTSLIPTTTTLSSPQYLIIADVFYVYQPLFSATFLNWANGMSRTSYMVPRSTGQVNLQSPLVASSGQSGKICF
jgi:Flp pilus assembly protein TadG